MCTYGLVGEMIDRYMENAANSFVQEIALSVLVVPESMGSGSEVEISQKGKSDFTTGYVLVHWQDLLTAQLADSDKLLTNPDKDYLLIDNQKVQIIGINPIPDLVNLKSFVKIQYQKVVMIYYF